MEAIAIAGLIIFYLVLLFGAISIFFGIFGTLIIFLDALIYGFLTQFELIGIKVLALLFCLYLAGELFEYVGGVSWPDGGLDPGKGHARLPNLELRGHLHQGQQQMGWCDPEAVPPVRLLQMGL